MGLDLDKHYLIVFLFELGRLDDPVGLTAHNWQK